MILDLNYKKIQYLTDPETSKNIGVNIIFKKLYRNWVT